MQRRGCGQQRGARHAHAALGQRFPPHDGHVAIAAFVAVVPSWVCRRGGRVELAAGCHAHEPALFCGVTCQIIQPQLSCGVTPLAHEQAGFGGQEHQRVIGMDHGAWGPVIVQQGLAVLHIQAGGLVGRQDGC